MNLKYQLILLVALLIKCLCFNAVIASTLHSISVKNHTNQSIITIHCNIVPTYMIFALHHPERIVIDFSRTSKIHKSIFPVNCHNSNLIKCIRTNTPINNQNIRIVCDLNHASYIETITQKITKKESCIILTILKKTIVTVQSNENIQNTYPIAHFKIPSYTNKKLTNDQKKIIRTQLDNEKNINNKNQNHIQSSSIIVAIDAGHGGQDPGAIGRYGIYEKNITLSIAKKLKKLLDFDPMFQPVMVRDGDYFLSVIERSDLARKKKANILISIHADSSVNPNIRGASTWILSNRRAKTETIHWLQKSTKKHAELLGGVGYILTNYSNDPYFNHLVLDLQFGYAQRESYNIAVQVLHQLKDIGLLHKNLPEYSNFGILRSPDIPSILVETGFISNLQEQYLLATNKYQEKIAQALYRGLKSYFLIHQHSIINHL